MLLFLIMTVASEGSRAHGGRDAATYRRGSASPLLALFQLSRRGRRRRSGAPALPPEQDVDRPRRRRRAGRWRTRRRGCWTNLARSHAAIRRARRPRRRGVLTLAVDDQDAPLAFLTCGAQERLERGARIALAQAVQIELRVDGRSSSPELAQPLGGRPRGGPRRGGSSSVTSKRVPPSMRTRRCSCTASLPRPMPPGAFPDAFGAAPDVSRDPGHASVSFASGVTPLTMRWNASASSSSAPERAAPLGVSRARGRSRRRRSRLLRLGLFASELVAQVAQAGKGPVRCLRFRLRHGAGRITSRGRGGAHAQPS